MNRILCTDLECSFAEPGKRASLYNYLPRCLNTLLDDSEEVGSNGSETKGTFVAAASMKRFTSTPCFFPRLENELE